MNQTYMKEKPILPLLISMSLPMILSMLVNSLYNIIDSIFVAKLGEKAMTAISLVYPIQTMSVAIGVGFGIGINALIAFYLGKQESHKAHQVASQGTLLSLLHGILLTIVGLCIMPFFLRQFTSDTEVLALGTTYSSIVMGFSLFVVMGITMEKIFQSVGRMKETMLCMAIGCIINIILDPIMIFGLGPIPSMGIKGAAFATVIGQCVTLILYLLFYAKGLLPVKISRHYMSLDFSVMKQVYAIGIPATLNMALPSLLISALNGILASFSAMYVVILGIYYRLQSFIYLPASGIIQGMRPILSYNSGAGETRRVKKIYNLSLFSILIMMCVGTAICLLIPQRLMGLFTDSPETIKAGSSALRIISLGFGVSSVSVTVSGALEALGLGFESLQISLLRFIIIILPAAFLLSSFIGVNGVWIAFVVTEVLVALFSYFLLKKAWAK